MQTSLDRPPGLQFDLISSPSEPNVLRSDIAGFAGPTERGPVGEVVRIVGWRDYLAKFGGLTREPASTAFAVKGFFENGGEIAHIVRTIGNSHSAAATLWSVGDLDPAVTQLDAASYRIVASSSGPWANGLQVLIEYRRRGRRNLPEIDVEVSRPGVGVIEYHRGLTPGAVASGIAESSQLIRFEPFPGPGSAAVSNPGPLSRRWKLPPLVNGSEQPPALSNYRTSTGLLLKEPEAALLALPDLYALNGTQDEIRFLLSSLATDAAASLDRQLIAALPPNEIGFNAVEHWTQLWQGTLSPPGRRTIAAYHPWIDVDDPHGGVAKPLRRIAAVGHVAGAISRLDRERGAHHTPANTTLVDAIDVAESFDEFEQTGLTVAGVNLLRCHPGRGVMVWGGRTLANPSEDPEGLYLAHRRLIHRLVRAICRVAKPLVFSNNGPALWLVLVRAITTVLLEAFRAGALKGERPDEAFRVLCDESNNPPASIDSGAVICEIKVAPAMPMEFITLRIALSADGRLELIEP